VIPIASIDDPRIAPYRNLKDRELAREGGLFIAEGELVLRRLLRSDYPVESVLLGRRRAETIGPLVPAGIPLYVAPDPLMHQIIGYRFHSGIIAAGRRKPTLTVDQMLGTAGERLTIVVLPETAGAENLGAIIRIAAAFGCDALLLGEHSCDPFWRQSIRVSMGTLFSLPLVRSEHLLNDLHRLRDSFGFQLAATVLDENAEPLARASRGARLGILFGNEAQGLGEEYIGACDRRITVPMRSGIDSLNVAIAAGIFLYHFTQERPA
jgi:tRNA G18 (ribose-2'-O)-methylase SpoU